jgi:hypothetical protein
MNINASEVQKNVKKLGIGPTSNWGSAFLSCSAWVLIVDSYEQPAQLSRH